MPLSAWGDHSDHAVTMRLLHELCHAAIHQSFGSREAAQHAAPPRFFEEGSCSLIAGQGGVRWTLAQVRARAVDMPLTIETFRADPDLAYAASFHFMDALYAKDIDIVEHVLQRANKDGEPGCVERALQALTGHSVPELWRNLMRGPAAAEEVHR